jgi:hypothetical protein
MGEAQRVEEVLGLAGGDDLISVLVKGGKAGLKLVEELRLLLFRGGGLLALGALLS